MENRKISPILYYGLICYLYIPILIFIVGWINPLIAIPLLVMMFFGILFSAKPILTEMDSNVTCNWYEIFFVFVSFVCFFILMGHNDLFTQDFDWHKHHAIFNDLMNYKWPVIYKDGALLTYYIGQYIVPSFLGKIFHSSQIMRFSILIWNAIGLTLTYFFVINYLNAVTVKKKLIGFACLLLWGGCTCLGEVVYSVLHYGQLRIIPFAYKWIDINSAKIHFATNYDALYGAFQHVLSPWISTCLFLLGKHKRESYVMIVLPLLFSATFGFVYLALIMIVYAAVDIYRAHETKWLKDICSLGNLLMLPLAVVLLVYLSGNIFGNKPAGIGFRVFNIAKHIDFYLSFVFAEFLGYAYFIWQRCKKSVLYYIIVIELILIPIFQLGLFNDLCSRGSIPARFILMLFCLEYYFAKPKRDWKYVCLTIMLSVSVIMTSLEFAHSIYSTYRGRIIADDYKSFEGFAGNPKIRPDEAYNYFTLDYEEGIFYRIAKHNKQ